MLYNFEVNWGMLKKRSFFTYKYDKDSNKYLYCLIGELYRLEFIRLTTVDLPKYKSTR